MTTIIPQIGRNCPCKECTAETGRCPGCHAQCMKYNTWKAERDAEKKKIKTAVEFERQKDNDKLYRIRQTKKLVHQRHFAR